jgi:hypothetical protein
MITWEFKPSFDKSVKSLPAKDKEAVKELAKSLIGLLEDGRQLSKGLGLTPLRKNILEIRAGYKRRIIFRWTGDHIEFILAGNHDQVRAFLKENT